MFGRPFSHRYLHSIPKFPEALGTIGGIYHIQLIKSNTKSYTFYNMSSHTSSFDKVRVRKDGAMIYERHCPCYRVESTNVVLLLLIWQDSQLKQPQALSSSLRVEEDWSITYLYTTVQAEFARCYSILFPGSKILKIYCTGVGSGGIRG